MAYDGKNVIQIIQNGTENADVRWNTLAEKVTLEYHSSPNRVPEESQDSLLRSPNVEHNNSLP